MIYSKPYKVTNIQGTQITAARGAKIRKRDAQRFKVITNPVHRRYGESQYPLDLPKKDTSTFDWAPTTETTPQRNQRQRRPPNRHNPRKDGETQKHKSKKREMR